jgi:TonB family protein
MFFMKFNKHRLFTFVAAILFLFAAKADAQQATIELSQAQQETACNEAIKNIRIGALRLGMSKAELEREFAIAWKQQRHGFAYKRGIAHDEHIRYEYARAAVGAASGSRRGKVTASATTLTNAGNGIASVAVMLYKDKVFGFSISLDEWKKWQTVDEFTAHLSEKYNLPHSFWEDFSDSQSKQLNCSEYQIYLSKDERGRVMEIYDRTTKLYILRNQELEDDTPRQGTGSGIGNGYGFGIGGGDDNKKTSPDTETKVAVSPQYPSNADLCANGKPNTPLQIISKPRPVSNEEYKTINAQGKVRLKVNFTADGQVKNITIVSGLPEGLNEKSIEAAKKITFKPEQKCGAPISIVRTIEYIFTKY